jgi:RNA recognition motif-containing protein
MNIFVGNLDYALDEIDVIKLFALYGDVSSIKLIRDKETGKSKGYAFVEMPREGEANRALDHVNGKEVNGKKIVAHEAKPPEEYNKEKELAKQQKPPFNRRPPSNRPPVSRNSGYERRDTRPDTREPRDFNRDNRSDNPNREPRDYNRDNRNPSRPYEPRERRDYNPNPGFKRNYPPSGGSNYPPKKED